MKARLNKEGDLIVKRGMIWKPQECIWKDASCGDWCHIFDEPEMEVLRGTITGKVTIGTCTPGGLYLDDFRDDRT